MTKNLKKSTAALLIAAMSVAFVTGCSDSENLRQMAEPEIADTVSDTVDDKAKVFEAVTTTTAKTTKATTTSVAAAATSVTTTAATTTSTTTTTSASVTTATTTTTAAPVPVTKATTTTTSPPVTTTTTTAAPTPSADLAEQVFVLVNQIRAEYGLPAFKALESLTGAAQKRATEISGYYSHTRPDGTSSYTVIKEYGLNYRSTGENIAAGQMTAQQVVNDWMGSTMGHREAILSSSYQYMGVGYVALGSDPQGFKYYWTQEFFTPL